MLCGTLSLVESAPVAFAGKTHGTFFPTEKILSVDTMGTSVPSTL